MGLTEHYYSDTELNWVVAKKNVYRILDDVRWIDDFFINGNLIISSFDEFRKNKDEFRGDKREGDGFVHLTDKSGNVHAYSYQAGLNAYVLCTTTNISEKVVKDFNGKGAIQIINPTIFGLLISKAIENCKLGAEGPCLYKNSRVFEFLDESFLVNLLEKGLDFNSFEFQLEFSRQTQLYESFIKHNSYEYQNEYRFLWFMRENVRGKLVVNCPEATQYCRKVIF
jgi:hypothetical protein